MDLHLDDDDLNTCVQCGLCLPSCPTFRVTGEESKSPRGRIGLMRQVQLGDAPVTPEVIESFATCVQCRGCEPACPSGVPYGRLIETTQATLASEGFVTPWWQRAGLRALTDPRMLRAVSVALGVAQRVGLTPKRLGLNQPLPLAKTRLTSSGDDVLLFTGCVMDQWQGHVHAATQRVVEVAGFGVTPTGALAPCCGALHLHAGLESEARGLAEATIENLTRSADDDRPILVDSAGCGAAMKEYGHLLGSPEAEAFARRVFDVAEWLAARLDRLPTATPLPVRVAIQDPCHLRHVQKVHPATRVVLGPYVSELVELDDEGLCCGAGGAFSALHPQLAADIRSRKLNAIGRAEPDVVVSANPGCSLHMAQGLTEMGIEVAHPMELIDRALPPNSSHQR